MTTLHPTTDLALTDDLRAAIQRAIDAGKAVSSPDLAAHLATDAVKEHFRPELRTALADLAARAISEGMDATTFALAADTAYYVAARS